MNRTKVGAFALAATAATLSLPSPPDRPVPTAAALSRPNVVLILLDDARFDDMSTMSGVVDRIGDNGATLSNFYSPYPLCSPSRATLLTGEYAHHHSVLSNAAPSGGFHAFDDSSTLATWLDPTYTTGLVGKYLNGYPTPAQAVKRPGWDEWMVSRKTYDYTSPEWSINTGDGPVGASIPGYEADTVGDLSADFIQRHADDSQPFFLYTALVAPHAGSPVDPGDPPLPTPYVKPEYRGVFDGLADTDPSFNENDVTDKRLKPAPLSQAEITNLTAVNAQRREAELSVQDAAMHILNALASTGSLDNTYVFFMSDNGYLLGEHRIRGGKTFPYQVSNRVPLLVRGPGISPGTVLSQLTNEADFAPTVLAMTHNTGAQGASIIDGVNLLPILRNPAQSLPRSAIPLEGWTADATGYLYHGVRSGPWKYIEYTDGARELYNLALDPFEENNVAARRGYAQTSRQHLAEVAMIAKLAQVKWCRGATCR